MFLNSYNHYSSVPSVGADVFKLVPGIRENWVNTLGIHPPATTFASTHYSEVYPPKHAPIYPLYIPNKF